MLDSPTIWGLLVRRVEQAPDADLAIDGISGERLTCIRALQRAEYLAACLLAWGVGPGSLVSWQLPTGLTAFVLQLALARLGAVQNPLISMFGPSEVEAVLRRCRPQFYLVPQDGDSGLQGRAPHVLARLARPPRLLVLPEAPLRVDTSALPSPPESGDAVRWIYVTSGTTAEPKGVRHADEALLRAGINLARAVGASPSDVGTMAFPIGHVGGVMYTVMLLASGASAVLLPRYQSAEAVAIFRRHGVTLTGGSTAHYQALLAEQRRLPERRLLPTLRLLSGGGAPKPPELVAQVRDELGCVLAHAYGMTEAPLMASCRASDNVEQLAHSDGAIADGMALRIVVGMGDGERTAAPGDEGEIRVRGPGVFKGYTDPALDEVAFDSDGWFRTGDLGRLRPDGRVVVTGRLKDVIIRKGENISAREIEDLLSRHPQVGAVAVIGLPDTERGERVCAVVEPRVAGQHLRFADMVAWFEAAGVMRQKIPEQLETVDALPRQGSFSKVSKTALRERFASGTPRS